MNTTATKTDHEQGYLAAESGLWARQVDDHFAGIAPLDKSNDWFNGFEDYLADIEMGNGLMYGLRRAAQVSA